MKLLFLFNFCVLFISLRCKVFAIITDEEPVTKPPILTESIRWLLSQYAETRNKDKESQNEGYFLTPEERSSLFGTQDQSRPSRETDFTKCPPGATGSFPYPPDCKRFLNCWKGRGTVQVCAPGTLFNPEGNECDFPSKVKCADAKTFSNDHYPQPSNLHQQYVRFPNGRPPIARNPRLNPRPQNQERFTDDSDSVVIRPPPQRPPYFGPSHLTRPQQRPTTPSPARGKSPNPTCPKGATGLFSHPTDCGKFLNCWDGRTFVQDCGPGTVFNPLLSVCDHPHKVDCSAGKSSLPEVNKELDPEYIEGDYYRGSPSNINNRYDSNKGLLPDEDEGQMAAKEDDPRYNPDTNLYDNLWDNTNNQKGTNDQNTYQNNKNPRPNPYSPNVGNKLSDKYPTQKPYGSPTDQSPDGQRYGQDFGEDRITDEKNSKNPSRYPKPDDGYQPKRNKSLDYPSKPNPSPFKPEFDAYGNPINPHDHKPYHNHHHYHHHHLGPYPGNHGSYPPYNPNVQTSPNKPFPRYPDNPQGHYQPPSGQKGPYAESDKGQDDNNKPIIGNKPATEPAPYGHRQPHHFHPHPHHHPHHHHHHHPYDQKGDPKTKDENPYGGSKQPTPPSYGWTNPPSGQSHPHHHPNHFYNQYPPPQPYPSSYDQNKGNQKPDDKQSTPIPPYYGWINPQTGEHRPNPYDPNQESPYGPNGEPNNEGIPKNTNNQDPIPQIPSYGSKNPYDSNPNYGPNTQHGQIPPFYGSEQDPKRPNNSNSPSSPSYPPSGYPHLHPPYYENEKPGFPQTRPDSNPSKNPLPPSKTSKQFPPYPSKNPKHDEKDSNPNIDIRSDPKLFTTTPDYEEISQEVLHKPNPTTKPSWNKEVTTQPKEPNKKKAFPAYPGKDPYKSPNSNGYNQPTSKVPMTGELDKPDDDYDQLFDGSSKTIVTEKAPLKVKQTPPNGQKVRLRGGSSQLDGYLEIQNLDSKWGLACDKENGWNTDEASVACRELGFIRGAELSWQGYPVKSNMNELLISVNKIQCTGNEVSFSECNVTHTQRNECDVKRNAVGLRCYPNLASHCQPGEVHFNQRCYRLVEKENFDDIGPAFGDASDKCRTLGGSLVDITTQSENDFISEWLIKDHPHVNVVVTGGIGYSVAGVPIWTWHGNQGAILFEKWWHGWSGKKEIPMGKINDPLNLVLKKTYKCEETSEEEDDEDEQITALLPNPADVEECSADYFFWDIVDMKKIPELGYPFICERTMDDIGCVVGRGESYTGTANTTASGQPCLPWDHPKVIEGLARRFTPQERSAKLTGHNYCRNVGGDGRHPWCFIEGKGNSEFCAIPQCYDSGNEKDEIKEYTGNQKNDRKDGRKSNYFDD